MKQFFKFMFASMVGMVLSGIILFFVFFAVVAGIITSSVGEINKKEVAHVKSKSILKVDLDRAIGDRGSNEDINIDFGPFQDASILGVNTIKENLKKAVEDDRIEGIYLKSTLPVSGYANLKDIREALEDFKESGKWIVAYNEVYGQSGYYMASVANEVYVFPEGGAEISGFSASTMFFKNALEKIGVEAQIIRGKNNKFKSAVEPFMYDKMSAANKAQLTEFIGDRWEVVKEEIAASRNLTPADIDRIADNLLSLSADGAKNAGLVDGVIFEDEFLSLLATKVGVEEIDDLNFVALSKYTNAVVPNAEKKQRSKNEIAVIYANGEITSGESDETWIGSATFASEVRKVRLDDDSKAVVLRINSPGGSALASEAIWRELTLLAKEKPLVVSMGNVAASGGYYIATPGAKIFANANTITGSIGVFGILPNFKKLANEKIGITFDGVKTNKFSDLGDLSRPLSNEEYNIIQGQVERIYDTFLQRVADGRSLNKSYVDSIGQGRVWSGVDALALGLVDELGDLDEAIEEAANMAELEDFRVKEYPKIKDPIEKILDELNVDKMKLSFISSYISDPQVLSVFKTLEQAKNMRGIQMRMPFIAE